MTNKSAFAFTAGDIVSFSAREPSAADCGFRIVRPSDDRLEQALRHFPALRELLRPRMPPLIISCYPAYLGPFPSAIVCDTYLRQAAFSRALAMAAQRCLPAIVLGQPLVVTDFLQAHLSSGVPIPDSLVICVGGYYCPASLESYVRSQLTERGCMHAFLHAYGLAEVDFAVFVGERRNDTHPWYRSVAPHVEYRIVDCELDLRIKGEEKHWHRTGDFAVSEPHGLRISPGSRLSTEVLSLLENCGQPEWARRTGYLARDSGGIVWQLRATVEDTAVRSNELNFWEFCRRFRMSFFDKPDWSISII